ncbi:MAG: hypothetical protein WC768_00150 [Patescibacteria group bacterium]|jgi:hypothetical protein
MVNNNTINNDDILTRRDQNQNAPQRQPIIRKGFILSIVCSMMMLAVVIWIINFGINIYPCGYTTEEYNNKNLIPGNNMIISGIDTDSVHLIPKGNLGSNFHAFSCPYTVQPKFDFFISDINYGSFAGEIPNGKELEIVSSYRMIKHGVNGLSESGTYESYVLLKDEGGIYYMADSNLFVKSVNSK